MSQPGTSTKAGRGADGRERFVVIRAMGLSVDGKVEAVVESEAFPTLEAAIGHSEYLAQTVRARGGGSGERGTKRGEERDEGVANDDLRVAGGHAGVARDADEHSRAGVSNRGAAHGDNAVESVRTRGVEIAQRGVG